MVPLEFSGPMVRYVPIEETVILIICFRESYKKNTRHERQIGRCNCILSKKKKKITTCASDNRLLPKCNDRNRKPKRPFSLGKLTNFTRKLANFGTFLKLKML